MNLNASNHHRTGLPVEHLAGLAGLAPQHALSDLKRTFLHALHGVPGVEGMRNEVLQAEEPLELWLLQASAFSVLEGVDADHRGRRQLLRRGLDSVFG